MRALKNSLYYLIPLLIFLFLFIYGQKSSVHLLSSSDSNESIPTFNLPTLYHPEKTLTNQDLNGKITLINFWASWCSVCRIEHPVLMMIKKNYRTPIFGIDVQDNPGFATKMLNHAGNPYETVGLDSNGVMASDFDVQTVPQTFLVDSHGVVRYRFKGPISKEVWEQKFLPIINEIEIK